MDVTADHALSLDCLGPLRLTLADGTALPLRAPKELALLAYLAVEGTQPIRREALLALLWPDAPEAAARNSLRVALTRLRQGLGAAAPLLEADRSVVWLTRTGVRLDADAFTAALAAVRAHDHADPAACAPCAAHLAAALALYRGPFLAGLTPPDAEPFEEWATLRREAFDRRALAACDGLASWHERRGEWAALAAVARRQLELAPWHEPAHRRLIVALAQGGDRGAALAQYEACRRILAAELGIEPEAETRTLAARLRAGDLATTPSIPPPHNLPAPLTPFVGREAELAALAALPDGDVRLLTIVGAGGAGKTRLALAAAWDLLPRFPDGVWLVSLADIGPAVDPARASERLAGVLAAALGLAPAGQAAPVNALAAALRERSALLILDNCEHLPEVAPIARALLEAAPRLRLLATSREPLGLGGEALLRLDGLPVPPPDAPDPAAWAGVRLFLERAGRRAPTWATDSDTLAGTARLVRLLDGLPLALELAAGWAGHYTPAEIAAEIAADPDFLVTRDRDLPDRHRSPRAAFDYTWRLLGAVEQAALCRLSIFRGGFDRAAAGAVAGVRAAALAALVDKSLLRVAGVGRYSLHALVRQFAIDLLAASGEAAAVGDAHLAHYLALAEEAAPHLNGPDQAVWLPRLDVDHDNLRAALARACEGQQAEAGLRLAGALTRFWWQRGYLAEGRDWLLRALAVPGATGVAAVTRARALHGAGVLTDGQGDPGQVARWLDESIALFRAAADPLAAARALTTRAGVAYNLGDLAGAVALFEASLTLARAAGDGGEIARSLSNLGEAEFHAGNLPAAAARFAEALTFAREAGRRDVAAVVLGNLGNVARRRGDLTLATTLHQEALETKRRIGARRQIAITLEDLAGLAAGEGRGARAARLLGAAAALRAAIGAPRPVPEQRALDEAVAGARAALGDVVWAAALADGRALSLDAALDEALA